VYGARLLHALLIARTPEADSLVYKLCESMPSLLCGVYPKGDFLGEGPLHLVAVSGKEELMTSLLQVALDRLKRQDLEQLFSQAAHGPFFFKEPMSHFGGTPVSYLATFGMHDALKTLDAKLAVRNFALNVRCPVSGYLPIHAAIVSSRRDIYDYLCDHCGCDEFALVSKSGAFDLEGLTPLQLATKLGLHGIFKHALRRRAVKEWSWGPVTSYMLPMRGIDTEGLAGHQQVMELVVEDVACDDAKMMLDHTFMNGFIYELFLTKWRDWAKYVWIVFTAVDVGFMVMLTLMASPTILVGSAIDFVSSRVPPAVTLLLSILNSEEQLREAFTFFHAHGKNIDTYIEVREALWHWVVVRLDNWALVVTSFIGCVELLASEDPATTMNEPRIRILFALSALFAWLQFFGTIFSPFENFNVFVLMVEKMVQGDIFLWFAIALPLTFAFTTATNALSYNAVPQLGVEVEQEVVTWFHSLESLTLLALIGLEPIIHLPPVDAVDNATLLGGNNGSNFSTSFDDDDFVGRRLKGGGSSAAVDTETSASLPSEYATRSTLGGMFMVIYTGFLFIVPLMLVNLLIAMMGNTYSNTISSARLEGRVKFARMVLSMELRAFNTPLGFLPGRKWRTEMVERLGKLGDRKEGDYYIHFRSYNMPAGMTHRGAQGDIFQAGVDGDELLPDKSKQPPIQSSLFKPLHRTRSFSVSPSSKNLSDERIASPMPLSMKNNHSSIDKVDMLKLEGRIEEVQDGLDDRLGKIEDALELLLKAAGITGPEHESGEDKARPPPVQVAGRVSFSGKAGESSATKAPLWRQATSAACGGMYGSDTVPPAAAVEEGATDGTPERGGSATPSTRV